MEILIVIVYSLSLFYIFLFSMGQLHLTWLYVIKKKHNSTTQRPSEIFEPLVTIQLPIYNERYVVERLLNAVTRLDYPRDRVEIQILDDSTDDTTEIILKKIESLRALKLDIKLIH